MGSDKVTSLSVLSHLFSDALCTDVFALRCLLISLSFKFLDSFLFFDSFVPTKVPGWGQRACFY